MVGFDFKWWAIDMVLFVIKNALGLKPWANYII